MKRYDKLIFVCNDDTVMGPMAEAIMDSKYLLDELSVTSRGVVVLFPEPINPKAEAVLVGHGLTMQEHVSEPLVEEDFQDRVLIMAVTEKIQQKIIKEFDVEEFQVKVLNEFAGDYRQVTDPYGGTLEDYGKCYQQLDTMISKMVIKLNEQELFQ